MSLKQYFAAATLAIALAPCFSSAASAQSSTTTTLKWDPAPAGQEICAYILSCKKTPGFIGDPGTITKIVPGNVTTTTMTHEPSDSNTVVFAVQAVGPPGGFTCQTSPPDKLLTSEFSNLVPKNNMTRYFGSLPGATDSDGDGLPDLMETSYTHTNPNNPDTDGDSIRDGEELARWDQWVPNGWSYDLNGNGTNGLNDPNADHIPGSTCPDQTRNEEYWPDSMELDPKSKSIPYQRCVYAP